MKIKKLLVHTLLVSFLFTSFSSASTPSVSAAGGESVNVWMTTGDKTNLLEKQAGSLEFTDEILKNEQYTINVNESVTYQSMDGFGGSLTDSSAWLIHGMEKSSRDELMNNLFGRTGEGVGFSYVRLPMGASDFARSIYTYNDIPEGQTDPNLEHFSIQHDSAYIIPVLKQALEINPQLKVMASPWSAPAWMKENGSLMGGKLKAEYYDVYAQYFVKFIQAYSAEGITIDAVTLQNEPHHQSSDYPSMLMEPEDQAELAKHLGVALENANIDTKIIVWDHNWDEPDYPIDILKDAEANKYITGTAFHGYAGKVESQSLVKDLFPDKDIYFTESSGGEFAPDFASNVVWDVQNLIIGATRNWAKTSLKWNIALNEEYGPRVGGCKDCRGIVTINEKDQSVKYNEEYYAFGQASRFVLPGAVRIQSNTFGSGNIENVAFKNVDGSKALIVLNSSSQQKSFKVKWGSRNFSYSLPAGAVATFVWEGTQVGTSAMNPYARTQAEQYNEMNNVTAGIATDDGGGQYVESNGSNSYIKFDQAEFVHGTASLQVRAAAVGDGKIEFRLGSPTGEYVGEVNVSDTGSLQSWKTKSVKIDGVTGTHDLYVVLSGSVRLNWFQFSTDSLQDNTNYLNIGGGFEEGNLVGWESRTPEGQAAVHKVDGDNPRTGNYKLGHYASEAYKQTTYRKIQVPNGIYTASVWYQKGGNTNVSLNASQYGGADISVAAHTTDYVGNWTQLVIPAISVTNGELELAITSDNAANEWASFDDVQLFRQTPKAPVAAQGDQVVDTPLDVRAVVQDGHNIMVNWSSSTGADSYNIYRSVIHSDDEENSSYVNYQLISVVSGDVSSYTDKGLRGEMTYSYRVTANQSSAQSAASVAVVATTAAGSHKLVPQTPVGLTVEPTVNGAKLVWAPNTENEFLRYHIYVDGVKVASVDSAIESRYTVTNLKAWKNYTFTVSAVNNALNESAQSAKVSGTPIAAAELVSIPNMDFELGDLTHWQQWHPEGQGLAGFVDDDGARGKYKLTHWAGADYKQSTFRTVEVPNGLYKLKVWVRTGGGQNSLQLEAKNYGGDQKTKDLRSASGGTWTAFTIDGIEVTNGQIEIGITSDAKGGNWAAIDDFELYQYPAPEVEPSKPDSNQGSDHVVSAPEYKLVADKLELKAGEMVTLTMNGSKVNDMYAYEAKFTYDATKLELLEATSQLKGVSEAPIKKGNEIIITHTKTGNVAGEIGDVFIGTLTFKAKESGSTLVNWNAMKVIDSKQITNNYVVNKTVSLVISDANVNPISFDDIKGHWAEQSIIEAASKGLINGYPGGKFLPNASITRTEFTVMLSRALQLEVQGELEFSDVSNIPNWAKTDVAKAVKAGLIQGYQDDSFRGEQQVTRAEIAVMVARSLNLKASDGEKLTFVDSGDIPTWAKGWVELAVDKGIMEGRSGNTFVPNDNATRAEATVMILRLLNLDK